MKKKDPFMDKNAMSLLFVQEIKTKKEQSKQKRLKPMAYIKGKRSEPNLIFFKYESNEEITHKHA